MATGGQVHWHEGLFLQPHHLQTMQRRFGEAIVSERRLNFAYPYGVVEMKLSPDGLENSKVIFDRLRVVMPSGLEVDVPETTELPPLDIKRAYAASSGSFVVSLAVPFWQANRGNTIEHGENADSRIKRIYKVAESEWTDENTGENKQAMLVRKINARLVLDGDDISELEVLPILRIGHSAEEEGGGPKADGGFVPACMVVGASPTLKYLVRDLGNQVEAARKELVLKLGAGFNMENIRGLQMEQLFRLRTLNKYAGRIPSLALAPSLTPFDLYLELREFLGDLAALYPDRDPWEAAKYDHDNPAASLGDLDRKIRQLLRGAVQRPYFQVQLAKEGTVMAGALTEEHLSKANEFFLAIQTKMDPGALAKLVEDADKFKLMPKSMWKLNVFGVKLVDERHPPMELPSRVGLHYFRLVRSESQRMWERIVQEKAIAVRWPELEPLEFTDMSLYMTVP